MDDVSWPRVYGCGGSCGHVPALLRALTDADPAVRGSAAGELLAEVYHQGTRWPASAVVVPFLVGLADDPATPDRPGLLRMLRLVAIGDRRDDALPFDARAAYPLADAITDEELRRMDLWLAGEVEEFDEAWAGGADRWARDAYDALAARAASVTGWARDPDPAVADLAAALMAWLPPTPAAVAALLASASASGNLTLAHLPVADPAVDAHLTRCLGAADGQVALTAAVALAYRHRDATPEPALTMLAVAADPGRPLPPDVPGWGRSLRGFVALALARIGW